MLQLRLAYSPAEPASSMDTSSGLLAFTPPQEQEEKCIEEV
jgi:hypothetical protein